MKIIPFLCKQLVPANHTHTWCHNMCPLRNSAPALCVGFVSSNTKTSLPSIYTHIYIYIYMSPCIIIQNAQVKCTSNMWPFELITIDDAIIGRASPRVFSWPADVSLMVRNRSIDSSHALINNICFFLRRRREPHRRRLLVHKSSARGSVLGCMIAAAPPRLA